jgi:biotin transport system substrate-specific component
MSNMTFATLAPLTNNSILRQGALVIAGTIFLTALSQVSVGEPVPQTLQTLGVMLIGLTFGFRLATLTLLLYLIEGAIGLPVFAGYSSGIAKIIGGTGGYLVGFVLAAALIGWLADRKFTASWVGTFVALFAGEVIIFGLGVSWLTYLYGFDKALEWGFTPFVLWDALKLVLAALIGKGVLKGVSTFARV